jgi:RNA polymerase sigma-70 factor (ECF subfamily)
MEDNAIIARVKAGEINAFSILVEKYHKDVLSFIFRLVGDDRIVEDIGQEVFLQVYESLKRFGVDRGTPFPAWLFIAAGNRCISELRRRKGTAALSLEAIADVGADLMSAEDLMILSEQRRLARRLLDQLAEPFKRPLLMSLRGSSLKEIAKACAIAPGTAKSRLSQARGKLSLMAETHRGGKNYEGV